MSVVSGVPKWELEFSKAVGPGFLYTKQVVALASEDLVLRVLVRAFLTAEDRAEALIAIGFRIGELVQRPGK